VPRWHPLAERGNARAGLLSGGEQQMLALVRGLMARPRVLLLDEPSLGLAPAIIHGLFRAVAEFRDAGITILLVDQMLPGRSLPPTAAMSWNRATSSAPAALREDPVLEAAYLGGREAAE
jgi:branched-chain amino acid transport system ATP-binding protein